ncbi:unnamed protein product, partial [Discosporangium mesarthrocarpum]
KTLGVVCEDRSADVNLLVGSMTAPSLAETLRVRENTLHICAALLGKAEEDPAHDVFLAELRQVLLPFLPENVLSRPGRHHPSVMLRGSAT